MNTETTEVTAIHGDPADIIALLNHAAAGRDTMTEPTMTARHLTANLLDITAHIISNTGALAVDTWMKVVDAAHNRWPDSFTTSPAEVFADGVQAMHAAGVGDHNPTVHVGRRADAIHTAARNMRATARAAA